MQRTWQVEEEMEGVEEAIRSGRTDQEDLLHAQCIQGAPGIARAASSKEGRTRLNMQDSSAKRRPGSP